MVDLSDQYVPASPVNLSEEISAWRHELRNTAYLDASSTAAPSSINGEALDPQLSSFAAHVETNRDLYRQSVAKNGHLGQVKLEPIFVNESDRARSNDLKSKTNTVLIGLIHDAVNSIEDLGDIDQAADLKKEFRGGKGLKKEDLLKFLYSVQDAREELLAVCLGVDENDENCD